MRLATAFAASCNSRNVSTASSAPRSERKISARSLPWVAARCSRTATSEENCSIDCASARGRRLSDPRREFLRQMRGQIRDGRMIVERLGRELELKPILKLHQEIHRHGGVEPKTGELRVHVDL